MAIETQHIQLPLKSHNRRGFFSFFQPTDAWVAIGALTLVTTVLLLAGAGSVLRMGFPAGALLAGVWLYQRHPRIYISYLFWVWVITPFVRRVADLQAGYQEPSPILLAPYLVVFLAGLKFLQNVSKSYREGSFPFVLAMVGITYAVCVGLLYRSPMSVIIPLLNWSSPILVGFFLYTHWREYPDYAQTLRRTFLGIVLVCGAYGIYQYVVAPAWDTSWLINTGLFTSGGSPEPYGMRVFSTMHSAAPFSVVMLAGLMLLFSTTGPLQFPASAVGYLSFLLTLVRSAWLAWTVGFLVLMTSLKPQLQLRLFVIIAVMVLCVVPLTFIDPFGSVIGERLQSFTSLEGDTSYNGRIGIYQSRLDDAMQAYLGFGLGGAGEHVDSAFIDMLLSLGWIGTLFYAGGLGLLLLSLFSGQEARFDTFASACRAIALSVFVMLLFSSVMVGLSGAILWGFLGMGTAANRYYGVQLKQPRRSQSHY